MSWALIALLSAAVSAFINLIGKHTTPVAGSAYSECMTRPPTLLLSFPYH